MSTFLSAIVSQRPDRLTSVKDESYHLKFGKWGFMMGTNDPRQTEYIWRICRNEDFYRNLQWKSQEDIDTFLKDQSGQDRNRIMFTMNMIRQLVEQYRGNSLRMGINFGVKNISPFSINRRERKLQEQLFFYTQAQKNPIFADSIKKRTLIGDSKEETIGIFNNVYVDEFTKVMNILLKTIAEQNEFQDVLQPAIAENLAFSGLGVAYDFDYGGKQKFKVVNTKDFFWDRNARNSNLQDSEYMGVVEYFSAPQILELAVLPLDDTARQSIENYDKRMGNAYLQSNTNSNSGQPVVTTYWRDTESIWYGYVMGDDGIPKYVKVNFTEEGEDKPRYTDKDLIDPENLGFEARRRMRGKKKRRRDIDYTRYCKFVPYQASAKSLSSKDGEECDIVLDYGRLPYEDNSFEECDNVTYPFKCWTWSYIRGEVSSPVDDAIDPQRFLNRLLSATENQINNSGGSGVMYDSDMYEGDEASLQSKINSSQPIGMNAKGRGMNNAIGKYDAGIGNGVYNMFQIVPILQNLVQGSTGVNEAMRGEAVGQDQLVGVTDALLRQGSLMQAPFYHALVMVIKQMYQAIANRGKKIYIDNQYQLVNTVGDYGASVITLSKDYKTEDFRVFVQLEENPKQLVMAANQLLNFFLQIGAIDKIRYANLMGRGTPDDVYQAVREYAGEQAVMSREQAKIQAEQAAKMEQFVQQQAAQAKQDKIDEFSQQLILKDKDTQADKEKIVLKNSSKALFDNPNTVPSQRNR